MSKFLVKFQDGFRKVFEAESKEAAAVEAKAWAKDERQGKNIVLRVWYVGETVLKETKTKK